MFDAAVLRIMFDVQSNLLVLGITEVNMTEESYKRNSTDKNNIN